MFETERLVFRNWQIKDAEALFRYASDCRVSVPAQWPTHTSVEMSREVIVKYFIPNIHCFAIIDKSTLAPLGCIGLVPEGSEFFLPYPGEREVGYWIALPFWGKGLATEALAGFVIYCREYLLIKSLLVTTLADNIGSRRVAEKCGFSLTSRFEYEGKPSLAFRLTLTQKSR